MNSVDQNPSQPVSAARESALGAPVQQYHDPDEINLLEYFYALVKSKWLIVGMTVLGLVGGYLAARVKGPSYQSSAVIAPRETDSQKSPNLSGLGMFGGIVASQLDIGGNASLDKIDIILDSRKFNAEMIEAHELMPLIYAEFYDSAAQAWNEEFVVPTPAKAAGYVKGEFLEKEINKNNTMNLSVSSGDSVLTARLLDAYLAYLDSYIRNSVQTEAQENRTYLEQKLITITDPLLRAKIQELIANEVEKEMVVSKEAFRIIDPPYVSKQFKEKKLYPLVFAFGLFFLTMLFVVFRHALLSSDKTEEDKRLIEGIKRELRIPFLGGK